MKVEQRQERDVKIERCVVGGFYKEFIRACTVYMHSETNVDYPFWIKEQLDRCSIHDCFEIHTTDNTFYVFSIATAIAILKCEESDVSQEATNFLESYEEQQTQYKYETTILSDRDRIDAIRHFTESIGGEALIPVPVDMMVQMVDAIRICEMQTEQIQKRLSKIDLSLINRLE